MKEIERRFRFKCPEDVTVLLDFEKILLEMRLMDIVDDSLFEAPFVEE